MFDFDALEIADPIPSDLSSGLATGLANVGVQSCIIRISHGGIQ